MDSPGSRPSGGAWAAPPADRLVLYRSVKISQRSVQSSESNELPARQPAKPEASRMSGKGAQSKEQVPCIRGHDAEDTSARTARLKKPKHIPPFWIGGTHLSDTHEHCMEDDDPLQREEYAAGFKLDRWGWRGTRPTGPTSVSPLYGSITRAWERESRRDHRPPAAFLTPKAPRPTGTLH